MKCAYCHDELDVAATCVECQTAMHFECWEELPDCPTLGCEVEVKQTPRTVGVVALFVFFVLCVSAPFRIRYGVDNMQNSLFDVQIVLADLEPESVRYHRRNRHHSESIVSGVAPMPCKDLSTVFDGDENQPREQCAKAWADETPEWSQLDSRYRNREHRSQSPLHLDTSKELELSQCRRRVVGRKKEEGEESGFSIITVAPYEDPHNEHGRLTW